MLCKYCNEEMQSWDEGYFSIEPTGFDESDVVCYNNKCPFYTEGFDHLMKTYTGDEGKKVSYRYMVDFYGNELTVLASVHDMPKDNNSTMEVFPNGGKQEKELCRFDLINSKCVQEVAEVLSKGAERYGEKNYLLIPSKNHIGRAINHLYKYLDGNRLENHLIHAICRLMFAYEIDKEKT